ncbi:MAG TPA: hypothetical protein VG965_01080 [Patescibacteria group bacterium]|nr:hypothetical protein [Patescibacteria group bacterium]
MNRLLKNEQGISVIEVLIVTGVFALLALSITSGFVPLQQKSSIDATLTTFLADSKSQQIKAMIGDTEGRATSDNYGIHFTQNGYTLFHGVNYAASDSSNFTINFDNGITASTLFPSSNILFASESGDIVNYATSSSTVTLRNTLSGEQRIISINRYGVVTLQQN